MASELFQRTAGKGEAVSSSPQTASQIPKCKGAGGGGGPGSGAPGGFWIPGGTRSKDTRTVRSDGCHWQQAALEKGEFEGRRVSPLLDSQSSAKGLLGLDAQH